MDSLLTTIPEADPIDADAPDVPYQRTGVWDSLERFQNATAEELKGLIPCDLTGLRQITSKEDILALWNMTGEY